MKKIAFTAVMLSAVMLFPAAAAAAEGADILSCYADEDDITVYASELSGEDIEAHIAGIECSAENLGDIYFKADKYETVFLIDSSKSMKSFSGKIDDFLRECIDKKRSNEYYSVGEFSGGNSPEYMIDCENDRYALEKAVSDISYEYDSTYIYDNLLNTIRSLDTDDEALFRRIVLITDGNENSAVGITIDDVIAELDKNPVPIYTVTLQTEKKDNIENLKKIARLARSSGAEDIRITSGGNAENYAQVLTDSAKNTYCINIVTDASLLDGSKKAIELSDGNNIVKGDIRMPMAAAGNVYEETEVSESISETETEVLTAEASDSNERSGIDKRYIFAAVAAAAVIVCVIIIIKTAFGGKDSSDRKNEKPSTDENADNDDTMIVSGRSGMTEILIDENRSVSTSAVILRDISDPARTYEVQLSADGKIIGRSSDYSDVVISNDKSVSRRHFKIYDRNGEIYIENLSTSNRTYLNSKEITAPEKLKNADEIKAGRTKLRVTVK